VKATLTNPNTTNPVINTRINFLARKIEEETKLIEAGFEYVRYSDKDQVAIYRKRK
jgi:hypothetical protein